MNGREIMKAKEQLADLVLENGPDIIFALGRMAEVFRDNGATLASDQLQELSRNFTRCCVKVNGLVAQEEHRNMP